MGIFNFKKKNTIEERYFFPVEKFNYSGTIFSNDDNSVITRCINKIANTLSVLPIGLYSYSKQGKIQIFNHPIHYLLTKPASEEVPVLFYFSLIKTLILEGNVYLYIGRNGKGEPLSLTMCAPSKVIVSRDRNNRKIFTIDGRVYSERDILHIPYNEYNGLIGRSPLEKHRELISLYQNLQTYIDYYFNQSMGTRYSLELDPTNYSSRSTDIAKVYSAIIPVINKYVQGAHNAGKVLIPPPGTKLTRLSQTSNAEADLNSLLVYLEKQICGILNVPYELVSTENKYGSLEERQRDFLQNCILPIGKLITQSFEKLIDAKDYNLFIAYNYKPMLETDLKSTVETIQKEISTGLLTVNEGRRLLDLAPISEEIGNIHFIPSNLMPLTKENIDSYLGSAKAKLAHFSGGDDKS